MKSLYETPEVEIFKFSLKTCVLAVSMNDVNDNEEGGFDDDEGGGIVTPDNPFGNLFNV